MVLAYVMAHEIGHLLGMKHSPSGIMKAQFDRRDLGDAAAGRLEDFRLMLRRILLLVAAVIAISVAGMALLGPPVLQILFHSSRPLARGDLALLALGSEGMMAAFSLAYACIALRGYRGATAGWVAGAVALVVALLVLPGALLRVEIAFCIAVAVACAVMAVALRMRLRSRRSS